MTNVQITIRHMQEGDLDRAMVIKELAGWNQVREDWKIFLRLNRQGCFVAVSNGLVIGTGTTLSFNAKIGWIAMILVDPDFRRLGVGTQLFNCTVNYLQNCNCLKLDATPEGRALYSRFGFKEEFEVARLGASKLALDDQPPAQGLFPIERGDLDAISDLDRLAFGANRQGLIEILFSNTRNYAYKVFKGGKIVGFVLGRTGSNFDQIGPLVTEQPEIALELLKACISKAKNRSFVVDVPLNRQKWLQILSNWGFVEQRSFTRMYRGRHVRANANSIFTTAGPELG